MRTAVLAVAARFVAERLNADHSDQHAAGRPCRCGHTARYAGRRAKTIRTALGAMTLERAYYHCASCRTGFCPRDRTLGIDETTLSPAATRMTAAAAARVSFKEASTLLDELAGLALDPKQVERTAEALGRAIAADQRTGRKVAARVSWKGAPVRARYGRQACRPRRPRRLTRHLTPPP